MTREIKFRFWDKSRQKFTDYGAIHKDGDLMARSETFGGLYDFADEEMEGNVIIQQYTGLKDKNGVEIYEGDVVEYRAYMAWHRDVIRFANGEFHGQLSGLKEEHQSRYSLGLIVSLGAEVIGNIYENPELLEEV